MPGKIHHGSARRQGRNVEKRTAILDAAERIFAQSGLAGARTDAIAAEAGVNKGAVVLLFQEQGTAVRGGG